MKQQKQDRKDKTEQFINRELSWLEFNERVLEEGQDRKNPLFERLKFLSIVSSNLDEFFMIRVASLHDQVDAKFNKPDASGLTPKEQLSKIAVRAHQMVYDQYNTFNRSIVMSLRKEGLHLLTAEDVTAEHKMFLDDYFTNTLYPVLTPMAVDKSRPFPLIFSKSLNIGVLLKNMKEEDTTIFATVQVPAVLGRLVEIPSSSNEKCFIYLEEIIKMYMGELFKGYHILAMHSYRITRNADLGYDEEGAEDLLEVIEQALKKRKWGAVIRLEVENDTDDKLLAVLQEELETSKEGIYKISGPLDLTFLMKFCSTEGADHLVNVPLKPLPVLGLLGQEDLFAAIANEDILMHHPYETFDCVTEFVRQAAADPNVLAIKQTLYRVSGNSPIVHALERAAENGKQVTVLLELKARFDEENNIIWARRLEQAGCHVIYGLTGLKTHCKLTLVVRKEEDGIRRYVHMGTGNYNDITARLYTDLGLFSANPYLGADASAIFNMLSGYSQLDRLYKLTIAPIGLRQRFIELIQQETRNAQQGEKAMIIAKMNSLVDDEIIRSLYEASKAGVEIRLIVRGICCLRPGLAGVSEHIEVFSIVDRFLEHSRIFYFFNNGMERVYLSSADWMPRNLDRRVELLFPVEDEKLLREIKDILDISLSDTVKNRELQVDGSYKKIDKRGKEYIQSQMLFYENKKKKVESREKAPLLEEFQKFEF